MRAVDQAIWIVAFVLYAWDAARLLSPHQLLLAEAPDGGLRPVSADNAFGHAGRVLTFAPLHLPHRGAFVAAWGRSWAGAADVDAALRSLAGLRASLASLRTPASIGFALLFVAGPVLTLILGPDAAVLLVAAVLYPTVVASIVTLWRRRADLGLTGGRTLWLALEILVCPAFLPNLVRKVTAQRPLEVDAARLVLATAPAEVGRELVEQLQVRAEDMLQAADADAQTRLRAYVAALRAVRRA